MTTDMADGGGLGGEWVAASILKLCPCNKIKFQMPTAQGQDAKCF